MQNCSINRSSLKLVVHTITSSRRLNCTQLFSSRKLKRKERSRRESVKKSPHEKCSFFIYLRLKNNIRKPNNGVMQSVISSSNSSRTFAHHQRISSRCSRLTTLCSSLPKPKKNNLFNPVSATSMYRINSKKMSSSSSRRAPDGPNPARSSKKNTDIESPSGRSTPDSDQHEDDEQKQPFLSSIKTTTKQQLPATSRKTTTSTTHQIEISLGSYKFTLPPFRPELLAISLVYLVQGLLGLSRLAVFTFFKDDLALDPATVRFYFLFHFFLLKSIKIHHFGVNPNQKTLNKISKKKKKKRSFFFLSIVHR